MKYSQIVSKTIVSFFAIFILFSCSNPDMVEPTKKVHIDHPLNFLLGMGNDSLDGIFAATSTTIFTSDPSYGVIGSIYQSRTVKHILLPGGVLTASNKVIDDFYYGGNYYQWYQGMGSSTTPPDFGTVANWGLSGSPQYNVMPFSTTMYSPSDIYITSPSPTFELDISNGLTLNWNSDSQNPNDVIIFVDYQTNESRKENPTLPNTDIQFYKFVDDNGSASLSTQELSEFPDGGIVNLYIIRGNYKTQIVGNKNYFLAALAMSKAELKFLK